MDNNRQSHRPSNPDKPPQSSSSRPEPSFVNPNDNSATDRLMASFAPQRVTFADSHSSSRPRATSGYFSGTSARYAAENAPRSSSNAYPYKRIVPHQSTSSSSSTNQPEAQSSSKRKETDDSHQSSTNASAPPKKPRPVTSATARNVTIAAIPPAYNGYSSTNSNVVMAKSGTTVPFGASSALLNAVRTPRPLQRPMTASSSRAVIITTSTKPGPSVSPQNSIAVTSAASPLQKTVSLPSATSPTTTSASFVLIPTQNPISVISTSAPVYRVVANPIMTSPAPSTTLATTSNQSSVVSGDLSFLGKMKAFAEVFASLASVGVKDPISGEVRNVSIQPPGAADLGTGRGAVRERIGRSVQTETKGNSVRSTQTDSVVCIAVENGWGVHLAVMQRQSNGLTSEPVICKMSDGMAFDQRSLARTAPEVQIVSHSQHIAVQTETDNNAEAKLKELRSKLEAEKAKLHDTELKLRDNVAAKVLLEQKYEASKKTSADWENRVKHYGAVRVELEKKLKESDTFKADLQKKLNDQKADYEQRVSNLAKKAEESFEKINELSMEVSALQTKLNKERETSKKLEQKLTNRESNLVPDLQTKVDSERSLRLQTEKKLREVEGNLKSAETKAKDAELKLKDSESKLRNWESKQKELERKLREAESKLSSSEQKQKAGNPVSIEASQRIALELVTTKSTVNEQKEKEKKLLEEIERLKGSNKKLEDDLESVKTQLEKAQKPSVLMVNGPLHGMPAGSKSAETQTEWKPSAGLSSVTGTVLPNGTVNVMKHSPPEPSGSGRREDRRSSFNASMANQPMEPSGSGVHVETTGASSSGVFASSSSGLQLPITHLSRSNAGAGIPIFACPHCGWAYKRRGKLNRHVTQCRLNPQAPEFSPVFTCPTCARTFQTEKNFLKHLRQHQNMSGSSSASFACSYCSFKSNYQRFAKEHEVTCEFRRSRNRESSKMSNRSSPELGVLRPSDIKPEPL